MSATRVLLGEHIDWQEYRDSGDRMPQHDLLRSISWRRLYNVEVCVGYMNAWLGVQFLTGKPSLKDSVTLNQPDKQIPQYVLSLYLRSWLPNIETDSVSFYCGPTNAFTPSSLISNAVNFYVDWEIIFFFVDSR